MRRATLTLVLIAGVAGAGRGAAQPPAPPTPMPAPAQPPDPLRMVITPGMEALTFDDAVRLALERNPGVERAAQNILRADALLQSARSVFQPSVNGAVTTSILNEARTFNGSVTQPQTQTAFSAQVAYPVLAASRWAQAAQARDQVEIANLDRDETRRQIAISVSQAYLAVIAAHRQVSVTTRALENGRAHLDFATARLQAGAGSRLNELRAAQEVSSDEVLLDVVLLALRRAQEALGVLVVADGPVDASAEPVFDVPAQVADTWLSGRVDIKLADAEIRAAERVRSDSWKDWLPSGVAAFSPQYVAPTGTGQPHDSWVGLIQFAVPIFDGGVRRANTRLRDVSLELTRIDRRDLERDIRAEERLARESVTITTRALESARRAAQQAEEVVRITDVAFRAGATTNIEVIDAQRRARDTEIAAAIAEDRARQARLDLLVALGLFPR